MFADPRFLYLLLLIPVVLPGYAVLRQLRRRRVKAFGDPALTEALMPSRSRSKGWVRISLWCLAFAFFVLGLARPRTGARLSEHTAKGAEIIVALDVSNSMLAQDYSPNRLERAKLAISRLTDRLQEDRIGLVIFAGTSFVQLPVTTDYVSAKMFLSSIDTGSIPVQGTAIGDAINLSIKSFSAQSEKSRVIVVISDGENHEDDAVGIAKRINTEQGIQVNVIGIGKPEGSPIPTSPGSNNFLKDRQGQVVVSRLNEDMCTQIKEAGGGLYVRADNTDNAVKTIEKEIDELAKTEIETKIYTEYNEQYQSFALVALFLLIIDFFIFSRKNKRLSRIDIFNLTAQKQLQ